ncbi:glucan endo-1,3-beta-glucosidase 1-like protein [Carex littledalei]|uniref:Glucan endo-1,3-beta-glucosidase 1-like protein n=1 Tax=Carex littledalei TaxID=544730 RepID=A0A833QR89_9POAL|nr:glucan endo-1,3-beta-glucosidase 1-like protein [Carex littledalei]
MKRLKILAAQGMIMPRSAVKGMLIVIVKVLLLTPNTVSAHYISAAKENENDGDPTPIWCVADGQQPVDILLKGLDWACGSGQIDCILIRQPNMACYQPNTVKDHASYAFNLYWQKFKKQGATCNFNGGAMLTEIDPSHGSCEFQFIP